MDKNLFQDNIDENESILIGRYVEFFINKVQNRFEFDGQVYLEWQFASLRFINTLNTDILNSPEYKRWQEDKKLKSLLKELSKSGLEVNSISLFVLSYYIFKIINEQYLVLLKPTIEDTIGEISSIKSITFENEDGTNTTTSNPQFIELINNLLEPKNVTTEYETEKIVRIDSITNNVVLQSNFVYWLATFFKEYFKDYPRRSNCCIVSAKEQELILYILYFLGLSPVPLTDSRFRQLVMHYKANQDKVTYFHIKDKGMISMQFVKYKDWKNGNIQLSKTEDLKQGETVNLQALF